MTNQLMLPKLAEKRCMQNYFKGHHVGLRFAFFHLFDFKKVFQKFSKGRGTLNLTLDFKEKN